MSGTGSGVQRGPLRCPCGLGANRGEEALSDSPCSRESGPLLGHKPPSWNQSRIDSVSSSLSGTLSCVALPSIVVLSAGVASEGPSPVLSVGRPASRPPPRRGKGRPTAEGLDASAERRGGPRGEGAVRQRAVRGASFSASAVIVWFGAATGAGTAREPQRSLRGSADPGSRDCPAPEDRGPGSGSRLPGRAQEQAGLGRDGGSQAPAPPARGPCGRQHSRIATAYPPTIGDGS